jgi:adenosylcobinamide-GDP ribazoletransferase
MLGDARLAIAFLTRIPAAPHRPVSTATLSRAAVWFPLVGVLVGGAMAGTRALAGLVLEPLPATVLALAAAVAVTGALHEDGLADCADAAGAHAGRERRLDILRDPRVGTFGALALVFAVLFAAAVLAPLGIADFARAAVAGHVLGRWSAVVQARVVRTRARPGTGELLRPGLAGALLASALAAATVVAAVGPRDAAAGFAVAAAVTAVASAGAVRAFGGATGDTFGATIKLVELATYATLAALWH